MTFTILSLLTIANRQTLCHQSNGLMAGTHSYPLSFLLFQNMSSDN